MGSCGIIDLSEKMPGQRLSQPTVGFLFSANNPQLHIISTQNAVSMVSAECGNPPEVRNAVQATIDTAFCVSQE